MDGMTLLNEASAVGLAVRADGDRLVVRGPRSAELLARKLLANKSTVFGALRDKRWLADPRGDLTSDSTLWAELLAKAYMQDGGDPRGVFGLLHGLRCLGAALLATPHGLRIGRGEICLFEYEELRDAYLMSHKSKLTALLTPGASSRGDS